jgi:hypothetical protein
MLSGLPVLLKSSGHITYAAAALLAFNFLTVPGAVVAPAVAAGVSAGLIARWGSHCWVLFFEDSACL